MTYYTSLVKEYASLGSKMLVKEGARESDVIKHHRLGSIACFPGKLQLHTLPREQARTAKGR